MNNLHPMLLADYYKISHRLMYPKGTQLVYSTWTARDSRVKDIDSVVVFGHQAFVKEFLVDFFNKNFFSKPLDKIVRSYKRFISCTLGDKNPDTSHIEALHKLGYLPLLIKGVPEGTVLPLRVPSLTIENTHPDFFWLTNYIETLASSELWPAYTAATIANEYRKLLNKYAMETVGNTDFVPFQGHDFSMRGLMGLHASTKIGMGHLLSFCGTDTIPAILAAEEYYDADIEKELVGTSIPATEHSIQCAYGNDLEYLHKTMTEVHPSGFVSIVSDGYDYWGVIGEVLPMLKDTILKRDGKVVIRPDSGDPVKIICGDPEGKTELERKGSVEALWDLFGGDVSAKGYKTLNPKIGLIYGDAITLNRAKDIVEQLKRKGFASTNIVFGIGSFTYQYNTRDTFGFALKSTACVINGKEKQIFKNPKTDSGIKKSQKGKVCVYKSGKTITYSDGHSLDSDLSDDMLKPIFKNGANLSGERFENIRKRLKECS